MDLNLIANFDFWGPGEDKQQLMPWGDLIRALVDSLVTVLCYELVSYQML